VVEFNEKIGDEEDEAELRIGSGNNRLVCLIVLVWDYVVL
jgi:hypothetical protein